MLFFKRASAASDIEKRRGLTVYVLTVAIGLMVLALLDIYAGRLEQKNWDSVLIREQKDLSRFLEFSIQQRIQAVESLQAFMLSARQMPNFAEFDEYAVTLMRFTPYAKGYGFGDAQGVLRHFYPLEGNEEAIGLNIYSRPGAPYLRKAVSERRTTVSAPVNIVQGDMSVVIRTPLFRDQRLLGHVQGVFEIGSLIVQAKRILDSGIVVRLEDQRGQKFFGESEEFAWTAPQLINVGDGQWFLRLAWSSQPAGPAWLTRLLIWFGGSLFLASLIYIIYRIQSHTQLLTRAVDERTAALNESESQLRSIVMNALNVIIVMSPDHRIREFNPEAERVYGRRRAEVLGKNYFELFLPREKWGAVEADLERVIAGEESRGFENEIMTADGSRRNMIWNISRMDDASGGEFNIVAIGHDITDFRQATDAIKENELLLSGILEALPVGVWITDRTGKIVSGNPAGQAIWAGARYVGIEQYGEYKGWWANTGQPIAAEEWALARAITKGETSLNELIDIECFDGTRKTILNSATPIHGSADEITGAIVVVQDVTQLIRAQKALKDNEEFLDRSQRVASVGSWEWDVVTNEVKWSKEMFRVYGMSEEEFDGTFASAMARTHPDDASRIQRNVDRILLQGNSATMEYRIVRSDGQVRWALGHSEPILDAGGKVIRVIGTVRDITERKHAEEALWENEIKYRTLFEAAKDAIFLVRDGLFVDCNHRALEMFGCKRHEIIGRSPVEFSPPHQPDGRPSKVKAHQKIEATLGGEPQFFEWEHIRLDGTSFHTEVSLNAVELKGERYLHGIVRDVTERMQAQERLQYLAHHDSLTGLPNRAMFLERLDHALTRARWTSRPLAVLFLDLDRFKNINDTLGHDIGDSALRVAAQRLMDAVREGDTVARLGGDEFTVLLEDLASTDDVPVVAQKILESVSRPFDVEGREFVMTTSIGISLYPSDGDDSLKLLRNADTAMYRAKEQGRNKAQFYSSEMGAKALEKFMLESHLRHALARREFHLYYQPQVNLKTGKITGVEALLRWQHPELGLVSPDQFIPVAEETGLMKHIDEWVLRTACHQAQAWRSNGMPPITMSVNLSGAVFGDPNLVDFIARVLGESCLVPEQLELEITENAIMKNAEPTVRMLGNLRRMGIRLAVDDFGTGYSSLSYLKRFPIDTLKIDKAFVQDVTEDDDDASLVKAIVVMGHALKLNVIAEGVETAEQLAFLRKEGCDGMQGYFFSRPLPLEEVTPLLRSPKKL